MTQAGMILGTAAYMSPEQARGKTVDKRADIWAFGAVLYEMLTGQRAFGGDDVSEVLSRVLQREPEWAALPSEFSPTLLVFLRRCLQKDLKQRIGDIHDVRLALDGASETGAPQAPSPAAASASRGRLAWMGRGCGRAWGRRARYSDGAASARNTTHAARDARRDRLPRNIRSHLLRPLTRRPAARLRGIRRWSLAPVAAIPGVHHGATAAGNRRRGLSLLVARQPLGRLLRRQQAEAARHRRRRAANSGTGSGRPGRKGEGGRRHPL
jgi:hypothetical protein